MTLIWRNIEICAISLTMPKAVTNEDLKEVLEVVLNLGGPVSLEEIAAALRFPMPRRTLQRRLARLVEQGNLMGLSSRGGRRYQAPEGGNQPAPKNLEPDEVPLSQAARDIRSSVSRPARVRKPVGYHSPFLEYYRPNSSAYLSGHLRHKLAEMGRTSGVPQAPGVYFRKQMQRLLVDLTWNSSRIAGNACTLDQARELCESGERPTSGKPAEMQMLLNHKSAVEWLVHQAGTAGFDHFTICNLHALLSDNLLPDPASGGRLRTQSLILSGTVYHPLKTSDALATRFNQILQKASSIEDPFEQSFFALVHLSYLQPFESMNQRVARLAANLPLIRGNFIPLSFVDIPQADFIQAMLGVCELNRVDYLRDVFTWGYERSCQRYSSIRKSLGEPDPFRILHSEKILHTIGRIVREAMDPLSAKSFILTESENLPDPSDRQTFATLIETELSSIHPGNLVRYRLTPTEYESWNSLGAGSS